MNINRRTMFAGMLVAPILPNKKPITCGEVITGTAIRIAGVRHNYIQRMLQLPITSEYTWKDVEEYTYKYGYSFREANGLVSKSVENEIRRLGLRLPGEDWFWKENYVKSGEGPGYSPPWPGDKR